MQDYSLAYAHCLPLSTNCYLALRHEFIELILELRSKFILTDLGKYLLICNSQLQPAREKGPLLFVNRDVKSLLINYYFPLPFRTACIFNGKNI